MDGSGKRMKKTDDEMVKEKTPKRKATIPFLPARFGLVRRSGRISKKGGSRKWSNTIDQALVIEDSDEDTIIDSGTNYDPDDDFVDPLPPPKKLCVETSLKQAKPQTHLNKSKDARLPVKDKTTPDVVPDKKNPKTARASVKPYLEHTGAKLKLRCKMSNVCELISKLNSKQKKAIVDIGFGGFLDFNMDSVPTKLGFWLVNNYDADTSTLNTGSHLIHITPTLVHDIFGIPMGERVIEEHKRPRKSDTVVAEWKGQFEEGATRTLPVKFKAYMEEQRESGRIFILNFLIFFNTFIGETTQNNTVNLFFLPSIEKGLDIKDFNWCSYMVTMLKRSKKKWDADKPFYGPIALLAAALAYDQMAKKKHASAKTHLIGEFSTDVMDELGLKLDTALFEQQLAREEGLTQPQRFVFVKESVEGNKSKSARKKSVSKESSKKTGFMKVAKHTEVRDKAAPESVREKADVSCGPAKKHEKLVENATVGSTVFRDHDKGVTDGDKSEVPDGGLEGSYKLDDYVEADDDHLGPFKHCADYFLSQNDSQAIQPYVASDGEFWIPIVHDYVDFTQMEDETEGGGERDGAECGDVPGAKEENSKVDEELEVTIKLLDDHVVEYRNMVEKIENTIKTSLLKYPTNDVINQKTKHLAELVGMTKTSSSFAGEDMGQTDKTPQTTDKHISVLPLTPCSMTDSFIAELDELMRSGNTDKTPEAKEKMFDVRPLSWTTDAKKGNVEGKKLPDKTPRPTRKKMLPEALCSPYVKRVVSLRDKVDKTEDDVSDYMFSAWDNKWDEVFIANPGATVMRAPLESLRPGITIHVGVIMAWANVLNYEERYRRKGTLPRLFCSPVMLWKDDYDASEETRIEHFNENMRSVLETTESKSIKGIQHVLIPINSSEHYYLLSFNFMTSEILIIDNSATIQDYGDRYKGWPEKMRDALAAYMENVSPSIAEKLRKTQPERVKFTWRTLHNVIDCGVFVMRHMETYKGTPVTLWSCGLSDEIDPKSGTNEKQTRELDALRRKYVTKILLSDINISKQLVEAGVDRYKKLTERYKNRLDRYAAKKIPERLNSI